MQHTQACSSLNTDVLGPARQQHVGAHKLRVADHSWRAPGWPAQASTCAGHTPEMGIHAPAPWIFPTTQVDHRWARVCTTGRQAGTCAHARTHTPGRPSTHGCPTLTQPTCAYPSWLSGAFLQTDGSDSRRGYGCGASKASQPAETTWGRQ